MSQGPVKEGDAKSRHTHWYELNSTKADFTQRNVDIL